MTTAAVSQARYHQDLYGAVWEDVRRGTAVGEGGVAYLDQMGHFGAPGCDLVADSLAAALPAGPVRLLELGAGFGGASRHVLSRLAASCDVRVAVGVDLVAEHCRLLGLLCAAASGPSPTAVCASVDGLGLRAETVDGVFAVGSVSHFPDMTAALTEAFRVLRPGGVLTFVEEVSLFHEVPSDRFRALHPSDVFAESSWPERERQLYSVGFTDVSGRNLVEWASALLKQRLLAMRIYRRQIADYYGPDEASRIADTLRVAMEEIVAGRLVPMHAVARRPH